MTERDALDRILASEPPIVPSSGFAARVRDAVEEAASEAPPLPFPWSRFTLAVLATFVSVVAGLWLLQRVDVSPVVVALASLGPELGYALAAMLATLAVLYAPRLRVEARRLTQRRLIPPRAAPWLAPRA
jgi:hypothetical protein